MPYLQEAIQNAFGTERSPQEQGRLFEYTLQQALRAHPGEWGSARFEDVWRWKDWPARQDLGYSEQDFGIDLVAKETREWGGGYTAIQAKFGHSLITTTEVDKFLAASTNSDVFASRILVAERQIARVGEQKIERAKPRCQILRLIEIDSWKNDWRKVIPDGIERLRIDLPKHDLRDYQREALDEIQDTFQAHDRGKLILPCGTGKSFVALKAAEENAGVAKTVLYLVPSISLMGQTMREWSRHRRIPHQYIGICSDVTTGKNQDLAAESYLAGQFSELCMPVTTEQEKITARLAQPVSSDCMRVVFCTYQSSVKIFAALKDERLRGFEFDLVICDEAHRTTGVESVKSKSLDGSPFQLIHDNQKISARKRLYMTATPRVFAENIRRRMEVASFDGQSYSMDDEDVYGPEAYRMSFADAINGGWLSDYRVVVIGVSEEEYLQRAENRPITFEDGTQVDPSTVVRLAGCWDALATPSSQELQPERDLGQLGKDGVPHARSAIAFTSRVKESQNAQKLWTSVAEWHKSKSPDPTKSYLSLDVDHLDAKTPASERVTYIESLRNAASDTQCRVLTNVGVLSEGVDVPALDAVVFLQSRSSPVDVTQAVGRVMRKATGKEFGYVVIPVVVPSFNDSDPGESAESLLSTSDFKPVWDVVRALRSHDERIDHMLEARTMPVVLRIPTGGPNGGGGNGRTGPEKDKEQLPLIDQMTKINERFGSLMLEACGDRHMYANWGAKAATVCQQIEIRLNSVIENHEEVRKNFESFHSSIQDSVSSDIDFDRTVRMVAHHLVTVPVFDQLFGESKFADRNPITQSMSTIIDSLDRIGVDFTSERAPLNRAYCLMNVAFRTASDPSKRLDVIRAIFDGFFRKAMPDEVKTMGIAYTPIEIVDFMIRFVDKLCRQEFGKGLTDRNVHILDPFVGTGTFIAHLLECKNEDGTYLIRDEDLNWKYAKELHANELVLLAYYIAALKIEETKHRRSMESTGATNVDGLPYEPFNHIVLTDTFHLSGSSRSVSALFGDLEQNSLRVNDQIKVPLRVILGNPPWSSGKDDASESLGNLTYPELSERISSTYVKANQEVKGGTTGGNAGGNLYVKAFRWATDRILQNAQNLPSVIAFVSPNSLTDGTSLAGMRKVLREEFTDIYVVNLRGNAYKAGEQFRKEGSKIFGGASRNGVQITFLLRNPQKI